eukprot:s4331_g8.t1
MSKSPSEAPPLRDVLDQVRAEALEGGLQLPPRVIEDEGEERNRCGRQATVTVATSIDVEKQRHLALLLTAKLLESCESTELSSKPFIAAVRRFFSVSLRLDFAEPERGDAVSVFGTEDDEVGTETGRGALCFCLSPCWASQETAERAEGADQVLVSKLFGESLRLLVEKSFVRSKNRLLSALAAAGYELGVFLDQIVLPVLVSGNSSYAQKHWMLQVSQTLFGEAASAVLAVFLIFDCDLQKRNVLERMIESLSRIATGKYTSSEHASVIQPEQERSRSSGDVCGLSSFQEHRLRILALGALLTLVKSLEEEEEPENEERPGGTSRSATGAALDQKRLKRELQDSDKAFNKRVLDALLESFDFAKQEFDEALRAFLAVFRLPGEGQKIDRLMQHFAAKFSDEDCVYVMMLQTSLHKPSIKEKELGDMEAVLRNCDWLEVEAGPDDKGKAQFISNNRGIDGGKDLPQEYLEALYDIVLKSPFSLQEDEDSTSHADARVRAESQAARSAAQKGELFLREAWKLVAKAEETMASEGEVRSLSLRGADVRSLARTLFEAACWPMLASLSVVLETQEEPECIELCITGFQQCIRAAARMQMDVERDAIVSSLAKFTYLTTLKEMRQKNIECIRVLMAIGISEGNNLGSSWQYVLHCISQLERLQLLRTRALQARFPTPLLL